MQNMIKNDETFICKNCGKVVDKLKYTSRNHCPYCLYSLHVDNIPGDRENTCRGLMKPIGLKIKNGKEQIKFECMICGHIGYNIVAKDDDREKIIKLTIGN